ncbi:MAG: methyltransferase domain-containing protein [Anaerolineae bacterium]|nr:methyltransferase domain-containing protein [Anaerolineae bacterium]
MTRLKLVQRLFDASADRYAIDIAPVLAPLVADFVAYCAPRPQDITLDLGAGTGLLTRALAPHVRQVVGVDASRESLHVARATPSPLNVYYARADIHHLPVRRGGCTLVVASLGLNATDPTRSLRAVREVIAAGGRLVLQEWAAMADVDRAFGEVFMDFVVPEGARELEQLRDDMDDHPPAWADYLQDTDDYREWLTDLGLTVEDAREAAPVAVRINDIEDYLRYKLAWTHRWEEIRAMDVATRHAFYRAARERLDEFTRADGSLIWQPWLFRVTARNNSPSPA